MVSAGISKSTVNMPDPKDYVDEARTSKDSQFPVDAIEITSSTDGVNYSINSDDTNPPDVEHSKSMEVKSEKSVIHDKIKAFEERSATGDGELLWESVQSGSDELAAQNLEAANQIASIFAVSDERETSNVDPNKGKVADASAEGELLGKDADFVALQEVDVNAFAQDGSIVKKHDVSTRLSTPNAINNPTGGNEITETNETIENTVRTWKPMEIGILTVAGATSPPTQALLMDSLGQNRHTPNKETSSHQEILDDDDSTIETKRTEVQKKVHSSSNHTESSNSIRLVNLQSEYEFNGLLSHGEGKLVETGDMAETDSLEEDISKQKIEYIDLKEPSSSLAMMTLKKLSLDFESEDLVRVRKHASTNEVISSSSTTDVVEDIVKAIQQQTTHDLLCPVCGSCITKRVILRKRKRTSIASLEKWHKEEIEDDTPVTASTERIHAVSTETSAEQITDFFENEEDEEWGCLACLTFFFRRARGVRRGSSKKLPVVKRAEEALLSALSDSSQIAHFKTGKYVKDTSEQRVNCIPLLFPTFPWGPSQSIRKMGTELTEQLVQKEDQGCLAFVFPEYPWGTGKDGEPSVVEGNQDNTVTASGNTKLQKDQNEIENIENEEIQTNISVVVPSAPEAEAAAVREVKDDRVSGSLSFTFSEYPWGAGENAGIKAEVTEEMEEHYAMQVDNVLEDLRTKKAASKHFSEGNCCFTFLLPDIHRRTKISIPNLDTSKETEYASIAALEWQTDTQIKKHVQEGETFEITEHRTGDLAVRDPIISDIEIFHTAKQKEEFHQNPLEKDPYALVSVAESLREGKEIVQEMDNPDEFIQAHGTKIEGASV